MPMPDVGPDVGPNVGPDVGERAPDFKLQSTRGEINLRRFGSGKKLVLAFYIEDRTPG